VLSPRGFALTLGTQRQFRDTFIVAAIVALLAILMSTELGALIGLLVFELVTPMS
jgi:hypothetical protein